MLSAGTQGVRGKFGGNRGAQHPLAFGPEMSYTDSTEQQKGRME